MAKADLDAMAVLSGLVLEDGRRWGTAAEPWQRADARSILEGPERYHFLTRPRGASKTTDLGAVATAALVAQLADRSRSYALAADRDQGALLVDSMHGFVERSGLAALLKLDAFKVTNLQTGATLEVLAADEASSWGLRPHLVIVDEFGQWKSTPGPRRLWSALFSALPKVAGSRLVILTSAGDPAHWSFRVLEHARAEATWNASELPGPCPWIAEEDLAMQRALLPEWEYRRLHLNEWTASQDRLMTVDDLRACVRDDLDGGRAPAPGRWYVMTLDVGLKNDRTVAAVMSIEVDGAPLVALERMEVWQGSKAAPVDLGSVEGWMLTAWQQYGGPPVVADPYQAAQLLQRLRARGVAAVEYSFNQTSVSRLALRLHQVIRDHALALPPDEDLLDELANVRLVERSPGVYRIDHDPDKHDDRAIVVALGVHALLDMVPEADELVFFDASSGRFVSDPDEVDRVRISPY